MRRKTSRPIGPAETSPAERRKAIWRVVAAIPPGRVATYGQVAALAGLPRGARSVGRALGQAPVESGMPWQRVIAASGRIALPPGSAGFRTQARLLRVEGVVVRDGRVNLRLFRWQPDLDELLFGPFGMEEP